MLYKVYKDEGVDKREVQTGLYSHKLGCITQEKVPVTSYFLF